MKILVINAGSSSLKYQLIDMQTEEALLKGVCERIGLDGGTLTQKNAQKKELKIEQNMKNHTEAIELVLKAMVDKEYGAISSISEISAVGHRVLHSAEDFHSSVLIDDEVVRICEKNVELGPLHMPGNIACIKSCAQVMPNVPMVAVFDTTFHSTMPAKAYLYGIPYSVYSEHKVRKYGFHGTSHKFVSEETVKLLGKEHSRIIVCHLGNGSSISAVKDGKCMDTSMGFTPLEGLVMGTRSGDIDPAAVEFMRKKLGLSSEEMVDYLNKKCGMKGVSEYDSDMRYLEAAIKDGDEKAKLAVDVAAYRIKKYIGSYAAVLNGVDAIVFTGGIGEHSGYMRKLVMSDMEYLGVDFDFEKNESKLGDGVQELSKPASKVKVLVLPTNEELSIARETKAIALS
ncbi:MAG: acetate kinase [Bacteroides sp.]|nr:acetate kinase [Bacillota bacterium]MCM1393695.1 acetate kinase [[Eubacterium] siraeum]MCM1456133.1 acetate kinase [Bacteroides sp.]